MLSVAVVAVPVPSLRAREVRAAAALLPIREPLVALIRARVAVVCRPLVQAVVMVVQGSLS